MNPNKSPGPDEIHPKVLKSSPESFSRALKIIFNRSLDHGEVPDDFKIANITPIYKKGNKNDPNNYRPISLTSIISKIIEKIFRNKIESYIENNNLLYNSQHGFRKGRSCLTNLLNFFDKIIDWDDNHNNVDIIYLDFRKAFDLVNLLKLIKKLEGYRILKKLN